MTQTIIKKLSFVLLVLFLFASCDKQEYDIEETRGNSEKICFEIAVGTTTATPSGVETRVTTSTTYVSTFENTDEIGVYIVKGSAGLQSSGNWVDNMKMIYNDGNWTPVFPSNKGFYPTDGDKLSFYAYYPYNQNETNAFNMNFGLTDQSSAANLSKSDLLYASTLNVGKGNNNTPVQLNFSHALAMVELKVTSGGVGAEMSSGVAVTLEGCKSEVSFNLSTRAASASGSATSVKMCRVEQSGDANYLTSYTYRAFVPAQTVAPYTELFRFSQTQGSITRALSHKPSAQVVLTKNMVKPYNITLRPSINPDHTYAVGGHYPYKGFPILGVVFEVSNGGKNGKVQDLYHSARFFHVGGVQYDAKWGDPTVEESQEVQGLQDFTDGYLGTQNLIIKRKDQPDFAKIYSIFNYIYQAKNTGDVNGSWYIPAVNELQTIKRVKNILDPAIEATGSTVLPYGQLYSMNEANFYQEYKVDKNGTAGVSGKKDTSDWLFVLVSIRKF